MPFREYPSVPRLSIRLENLHTGTDLSLPEVMRSNTTIRLRARPLPPKTFVTVPSLDSHSNSLPIHRERHAIVNEAILTTLLRRG